MALPDDVTTFELTFGPYTDAAGEPVFAGMTGKIKPSFPQIRHVGSGAVVIDSPIPVVIDGFGVASVELAHTDQAILSPVGFTYSVVWDVASRKPSPGNKQFAVPTSAGATVDFDLLAPSPDVEGVVVPLTYGKSAYDLAVANGFVGTEAAWLASLRGPVGEVSEAELAAGLANKQDAATLAADAAAHVSDGSALDVSLRAAAIAAARSTITAGAIRLAGFGDSVTDGTSTSDDANRFTDTTWLHLADALSMGKIDAFLNAGVGGENIEQVVARVQSVINAKPTHCVLLAGTNNVGAVTTDAAVLASIDTLFTQGHDKLRAAGIQSIAVTIPPRNGTSDQLRQIALANQKITRLARGRGMMVLDFHGQLVDPATGQYLAALSGDGVHPNRFGCRTLAQYVVAQLTPLSGPFAPYLARWNDDPTNLLTNGLFLGTTSTVASYPMPAGWSGGTSNQRAIDAGSDGLKGNWFRLYKDAATAPASGASATSQNVTTGFAPGDVLEFACRHQLTSVEAGALSSSSSRYVAIQIVATGPGTLFSAEYQWQINVADCVLHQVFTVPAATTALAVGLVISGEASGRWGQMTLRNLTALGLT